MAKGNPVQNNERDFLLDKWDLSTSAPTEIRTPVVALKGPRPGPLDDGGVLSSNNLKDF